MVLMEMSFSAWTSEATLSGLSATLPDATGADGLITLKRVSIADVARVPQNLDA
jgi:hypothetical protein